LFFPLYYIHIYIVSLVYCIIMCMFFCACAPRLHYVCVYSYITRRVFYFDYNCAKKEKKTTATATLINLLDEY
jgi:hypothetical protein